MLLYCLKLHLNSKTDILKNTHTVNVNTGAWRKENSIHKDSIPEGQNKRAASQVTTASRIYHITRSHRNTLPENVQVHAESWQHCLFLLSKVASLTIMWVPWNWGKVSRGFWGGVAYSGSPNSVSLLLGLIKKQSLYGQTGKTKVLSTSPISERGRIFRQCALMGSGWHGPLQLYNDSR